jgi:hypothetical protein
MFQLLTLGLEGAVHGASGGNIDGLPCDTRVDLGGRTRTWNLFATDTQALNERLHLTCPATTTV